MKLITKEEIFTLFINEKQEIRFETEVTEDFISVCEIDVCPLNPEESNRLLRECNIKEWDRGQRFESPDFYKYKIKKIDKVIRAWRNMEDINGDPLACTKVNKALVYKFDPEFIDNILEKTAHKSSILSAEKEYDLGN